TSAIPSPARLNPEVPTELDAIAIKSLQRDPVRRYQTAAELERALASFVLSASKTVDDTDVAKYLGTLFADEIAGTPAEERTDAGPAEAATPIRERTALMKKGASPAMRAPPAQPLSPDEDYDGKTALAKRTVSDR